MQGPGRSTEGTESWPGSELGRNQQTETQDTGVKRNSPLGPPLPHSGECEECDELIRSGLLLHLAQSPGGGLLCHPPYWKRWGLV